MRVQTDDVENRSRVVELVDLLFGSHRCVPTSNDTHGQFVKHRTAYSCTMAVMVRLYAQ